VTAAARSHGYSRAEFYLVAAAFDEAGMTGLLDERRGRKGPMKLTENVQAFLDWARTLYRHLGRCGLGGTVGGAFAPRTIQRARQR